jgi:hypothetical protein
MKTTLLICCLSAALFTECTTASEPDDQTAAAQAAIAAFGGALKAELTSAMQAGGPLNAIEVCHSRAQAIAEAVSSDSGMQLARVSLRNRNPANAPNAWQTPVLQDFENRLAAGERADALTWQEVAETGGQREFRLMKAIPTAGLCLACHGEAIAPPVAEKIAELYPEDKATGFREGDIRGAFVVTKALD